MNELSGMPKKDPLYRLCEEYVDLKETIRDTKDIMDQMKDQLISTFQVDGRDKITIRGYTVSYKELQKISCSSPKS